MATRSSWSRRRPPERLTTEGPASCGALDVSGWGIHAPSRGSVRLLDVLAVARRVGVARAADEGVLARAAGDRLASGAEAGVDAVVAGAALEAVLAVAADQGVVA